VEFSKHQHQDTGSARIQYQDKVRRSVRRNRVIERGKLAKAILSQNQHQNEKPARVGHGEKICTTGLKGAGVAG